MYLYTLDVCKKGAFLWKRLVLFMYNTLSRSHITSARANKRMNYSLDALIF